MTPPAEIRYELSPSLTESDLEPLFAEAWGTGLARGYDAVLRRSLCYIVARLNFEIVGFVNVAWDGRAHAFLLDTVVREKLRRNGIGLELVHRAASEVRDAGVEWLHVDFEPHLDAFYSKAGLRPTSARLLHFATQDRRSR